VRFLSLFSGIGGFDLALERAGHECVGQVEIDGFCQRVLERRFTAPRWDDVVGFPEPRCLGPGADDGSEYRHGDGPGRIDLLCGGFPCQDLSVAGKRAGLAGERSGLFYEILRIQKIVNAPWGLFENVPGLFSSHGGRDMASVLEGLRQCWPVVGYRVLDSRYFGVPQRRRRIFFACGPTERGVEAVLFEPEGRGGDSQAGGEAGEGTAGGAAFSTLNSGGCEGGFRTDPGEHLVAWALQERDAKGPDSDTKEGHLIVAHAQPTARADGVPLVPILEVGCRTNGDGGRDGDGIGQEGDPMFTLQAGKQHGGGVRRLTPTECERLQGFPDGWTCLCDQDPCRCPDSPRYRALGNAVTVSVVEWLARRLPAEPPRNPSLDP